MPSRFVRKRVTENTHDPANECAKLAESMMKGTWSCYKASTATALVTTSHGTVDVRGVQCPSLPTATTVFVNDFKWPSQLLGAEHQAAQPPVTWPGLVTLAAAVTVRDCYRYFFQAQTTATCITDPPNSF